MTAVTTQVTARRQRQRNERRDRILDIAQTRGVIAVLIVAALAAGLIFPNFLTGANLGAIVTASCFLALVTIGQSFVIIMGGFDLSVGSLIGLGSVLAAYTVPFSTPLGFVLPIVVGGCVGLINGLLIAKANMAPFIVTLASLLGVQGVALALAQQSIVIKNPGVFSTIANGNTLGINNLIIITVVFFAGAALLLNRTGYGTAVFAIGGNEEAARMFGVRVDRIKILTYVLSGCLAGLSGALLSAQLSSGLATAGTGYELQSIAAAVIGGVLLTGGVGTMAGALAGALLLGLIQNVINQVGTLNSYYQNLVSGLFLVVAVVVQSVLSRSRGT